MTGILNAIAEWGITPWRYPPPIVILSKGRSPASKDLFPHVKSAEKPVPGRAAVSSVSGDMSRSMYHASSRPAIAYGDPFDSKHSFSLRMTGILNAIAEWGITPWRDPPPPVILSKGRSPASKDLFPYIESAKKPVPGRATVSSVSGDMSRSMYHASSRPAIAGSRSVRLRCATLRMTKILNAIASAGTHDSPHYSSRKSRTISSAASRMRTLCTMTSLEAS